MLIEEILVIFHLSFSVVYLERIFYIKLKGVGWDAHSLTVYHQRIIRKMLIYGNIAMLITIEDG